MRLISSDLEKSVHARTAQSELERARHYLESLEAEVARLREVAPNRNALLPSATTPHANGRHAERIIQEMMAFVQLHYQRPMSLGEVAAALKMNAAYLSTLFRATAGVTFHKYLEGVRLAKAQELLRNPHYRVCEVASAVGYASADQFRHAFKAGVGVAPSIWR